MMNPMAAWQDERSVAAPAAPLDARRLRAAFLDLYGRPPLLDERERFAGRGLSELVDEALAGETFWRNWTDEQLYYFLLIDNFHPADGKVEAIPKDLAAATIGVRDAIHRIAISSSFDRRNPGPDTFVTVVMEQLLGLTVQSRVRDLEIGKKLYDGGTGNFLGQTGRSQADVVNIAIEDRRMLELLLEREHERVLRATPDARALKDWTRRLERDDRDFATILREWFLSPAWEARLDLRVPMSNRMFVRSLFVDLADRLPADEEGKRMRGALDGLADARPLRSVLARLILDSGRSNVPEREAITDPTTWVAGVFERLLGRSATPDELATFVAAFHDPECRSTTVVYAVLSHPNYSTW